MIPKLPSRTLREFGALKEEGLQMDTAFLESELLWALKGDTCEPSVGQND
jgi:hypothetical protein